MARDVEPWPAWVRYPLIGVLVVIGVSGLYLAVTRGVEGALVRVLIAAVVIPALLLPIQLIGLRRRGDRLVTRLDTDLRDVADRLAEERRTGSAQRASGASDTALDGAIAWVAGTRRQLGQGDHAETARSVEELDRMTGAWPSSAPVRRAVRAAAGTARTLARVSARAARSER